jgi:glycosyltransferase involved in cell wall biosynthesis
MIICHISTVHRRDDIRIYRKEIVSLLSAGYEIDYVTPKKTSQGEAIDLNRVNIIPIKTSSNKFIRIFTSTPKTIWMCLKSKAAIFHAHDPELIFTLIILRLLGKVTVLDVHEDYEQQIVDKLWIPSLLRFGFILPIFKLIHRIGKKTISRFIVVTEHIGKMYPLEKTFLVQNFPLQSEINQQLSTTRTYQRSIDMSYFGEISSERNFENILNSYIELHEQGHPISFKLGGRVSSPGIKELITKCESLDGFEFLEWVSREEMLSILSETKLGLVLFKPLGNHINAQPNKIFEYMASGVPILCSNFPLWEEVIVKNDVGISVDPLNKEAMKTGILTSLETFSSEHSFKAQKLVKEKFNWDNEFFKLVDCYKSIPT